MARGCRGQSFNKVGPQYPVCHVFQYFSYSVQRMFIVTLSDTAVARPVRSVLVGVTGSNWLPQLKVHTVDP